MYCTNQIKIHYTKNTLYNNSLYSLLIRLIEITMILQNKHHKNQINKKLSFGQ